MLLVGSVAGPHCICRGDSEWLVVFVGPFRVDAAFVFPNVVKH